MDNSALRERYASYDQDSDGQLDLSEFGSLLDGLGLGYTEAQTRAAFESVDVNADGRIDFDEFARWWVD